MDYTVVSHGHLSALIGLVKTHLKEDWELQGGISIGVFPGIVSSETIYAQALIKKEKKNGKK